MQNDGKVKNIFVFLIILNCIVLVLVVKLSSNTYAQVYQKLHENTLHELSNHTSSSQSAFISVGKGPSAIAVGLSKVYVANGDDGTVSVIDTTSNNKIGNDIKVGKYPYAIGIDDNLDKVYVANMENGTISVINARNNTIIGKPINVGGTPSAIGIERNLDKVYVVNFDNAISVINATNDTIIGKPIKVGNGSSAIAITNNAFNYNLDKVYVANHEDGTISVINATNDTIIGKPIKVGNGPSAIGIGKNIQPRRVYVANTNDGTISVINARNNTIIGKPIKVGNGPIAIGVGADEDKVYVANYIDDDVSVINARNNTIIGKPINVGKYPDAIDVEDIFTNTAYVANMNDGSVSVIDGEANKVVARVTFNTEPFNGGHIECDKDIVPIAKQFYVYAGSECTAKPNEGFGFVSWQENLGRNSTQILQFSSPNTWDSIMDFLHLKHDRSEATLNITKFGRFTANFKELPPPIPPEYLLGLFTIVGSTIVGWSIPSIVGWLKAKKQGKKLHYYHKRIGSLYDDGKLDENDFKFLDKLKNDMTDSYAEGKMSNEQYTNLKEEISVLYEEIFRKKINSLNSISHTADNDGRELLDKIKYDISDAFAKGKINESHYSLLDKMAESKTTNHSKINANNISSSHQTEVTKRSPI